MPSLPRSSFSCSRVAYAVFFVLSAMGAPVNAATYSFTGGTYTALANFTPPCVTPTCGNFNGTMRISGTFTTSVPLPPGLVAQPIRPLITDIHVTDGQTTYDYADPQLRFRRADVSTDATGAITSIDFLVQRWAAPGPVHAPLDRLDMVRLATGSSTAFKNLFCNSVAATVDADSCFSVNLDGSTSRADGAGGAALLVATPTSVPTLNFWALLALATSIAFGGAMFSRGSASGRG